MTPTPWSPSLWVRVRDGDATSHLLRIPVSWLAEDVRGFACVSDVALIRLPPRAPENHINVATVGSSNGMVCFSPGVILCLTLPWLLQTHNFADLPARESGILHKRLALSLPDGLASDSTIRLSTSYFIDMHRLLSLASFKKAQQQDIHAAEDAGGSSGSGETDGPVTNGTDSHGPARSETNGASPESNIDVSVLTNALPLAPINQ